MEKEEIQDNLNDNLIAQDNDLITSVAKMDKTPLKIFEIAVGALDAKNTNRTVQVKKQVIYDLLGQDDKNKSTRLRNAMMTLQTKAVFEFGTTTEHTIISPVEKISWNKRADHVDIMFSTSIIPYIQELKKNFTQYRLADVAKMDSKHSIVIYKLIAMNYNQYEYYNKKQAQASFSQKYDTLHHFANPIFTVDELRRLTSTTNKYQGGIGQFENKILKVAVSEISEKTDFKVTYDKIKTGRKVTKIQFHISKGDAILVNDGQAAQEDIVSIQQKPYTSLLVGAMLLPISELNNLHLLNQLNTQVYPKYQELESKSGLDSLKQHLNYVSEHKGGQIKNNQLVSYLEKSITNYLSNSSKGLKTTKIRQKRYVQRELLPDWAINLPKKVKNSQSQQAQDEMNRIEELLKKTDN